MSKQGLPQPPYFQFVNILIHHKVLLLSNYFLQLPLCAVNVQIELVDPPRQLRPVLGAGLQPPSHPPQVVLQGLQLSLQEVLLLLLSGILCLQFLTQEGQDERGGVEGTVCAAICHQSLCTSVCSSLERYHTIVSAHPHPIPLTPILTPPTPILTLTHPIHIHTLFSV